MVKRGIALYDLHYPDHNYGLLKNVERYMREGFDYIVYGGDTMDLQCISRHALFNGNQRALEGKRLKSDCQGTTALLERHQKTAKPERTYYLKGNHEDWIEAFVDKFPQLEGILDLEENIPFHQLGIDVVKPRGFAKIGKLHFIHGDLFGKYCPVFHAKKVVELYNRNVVYGDRHQYQSFVKASPVDIKDKHGAWCVPTMSNVNPEWAKDKPNNWVNGFAVFYVDGDWFNVYPVLAQDDGGFISPEGRRY